MTAIALIDICSLLFDVHREVVNLFKVLNICYSKETDYKIIWLEIFMDCFRNFTRRCSTWLSFSITLIRTLIIIPCILYPIATFLLVQGIRKAGKQRKEMVSSSSAANSKDASNLVLATTLTFFFAELPLGIIYMLDPFAGFKEKGFDMQ
ncbi:unnamed protein product [Caenorhabditis nigoni]